MPVLAAVVLVFGLAAPAAPAATLTWGSGIAAVPPTDNGTPASVAITAVSCPSPGNCTAVGTYVDTSARTEGILLTESGGSWGNGVRAGLPAGANSTMQFMNLTSVSCVSAGNCVAVGYYDDSSNAQQGLILTETGGTWATGEIAPMPSGAGANPVAALSSVTCVSSGNCVAVGGYTDTASAQQGLILTLSGGTWSAQKASLPAGADGNPGVNLTSVSCVAVGSCAAVGHYEDTSLYSHGLLLTDSAGTWTPAEAMLPTGAAADPAVSLSSVSCVGGTLDCAAAGRYEDNTSHAQGLLISATNGSWATGSEATLPSGGTAPLLNAISCASAGNCTAVGYYVDSASQQQGLLLTETGGTWANGVEAPVPSGSSGSVSVLDVSCWAPGNCGAAGIDGQAGLLLGESDSSWSAAGAMLPSGGVSASMFAVSCPGTASCVAGGQYEDDSASHNVEGLLVAAAPPLASPTLALTAPVSGTAGIEIQAPAITAALAGGSAPTGSVSFTVFGPQSSPPTQCSSGGTPAGSGAAGSGTGIHPSAGFTPAGAGDYWWYATYNGDSDNNPAGSPCGAGMPETVVAAGAGGGSTMTGGSGSGSTGTGGSGGASVLVPSKPKVSGHRVSDAIGCRGVTACVVILKLTTTEKPQRKPGSRRPKLETLVLASGSATIGGGHRQTVTLTLNAEASRSLALHHILVAKLKLVFNGRTVAVYTVTFRAPSHHKQ